MTREELLHAVPIRTRNGLYLVALKHIPQPVRDQFERDLYATACPVDDELGVFAFAWDWSCWVCGEWWGRGPDWVPSVEK